MLDRDFVIAVHDEIILQIGGLPGLASGGLVGVEAALGRVEMHGQYAGLDDVFGIAALYAVSIARGHVFNDGNKRTGLTCALAYLERQAIRIPATPALEQVMVDVAAGTFTYENLAALFSLLWTEGEPVA